MLLASKLPIQTTKIPIAFWTCICAPTLKKVPPPLALVTAENIQTIDYAAGYTARGHTAYQQLKSICYV